MVLETLLGSAMLSALTVYALSGGADYGAGVWYLLAGGIRGSGQRSLIRSALSPIWEANHVWLIIVVTILFTAFPPAFSLITTSLHIPLTVVLLGIVMRGSAFAFRTNEVASAAGHRGWDWVFAWSSVITPLLLGIAIGAIASGQLTVGSDAFTERYLLPWLRPFPLAVGLLTVSVFALLAAVYLTVEARDPAIQEDFRRRAVGAMAAVAGLSVLVFVLAHDGAPELYRDFSESRWRGPIVAVAAFTAMVLLLSLWFRRYRIARVASACHAAAIIWGWGFSQFPYLVEPDLTLYNAAAPRSTMVFLLWVLFAGALLLFPSLYYLFRVFKGRIL